MQGLNHEGTAHTPANVKLVNRPNCVQLQSILELIIVINGL